MGKDIFISHAWGTDSNGRDNHLRCKKIADFLILTESLFFGFVTIMNCINNALVVLICLTEKYFDKINNAVTENKTNDNCFKEWNYSMFKQKKIIPVILDKSSSELYLNKGGIIQMYLSSCMFINFSNNFKDDSTLLLKTLRRFDVYNHDEKKFYNIKTNSSFDNLVNLFNEKIKSISPRKKHLRKQKILSNYLQNLSDEFVKSSKNIISFQRKSSFTSKKIRNPLLINRKVVFV